MPISGKKIIESGELEDLSNEEAGAFKVYGDLPKYDRTMIIRHAKSLNLEYHRRGDGALVVYTRTKELVFGVVPYDWEEVGLHPELIRALHNWTPEPITTPTHIQAEALRKLLIGKDLVIQAETGSGKTLAYMLPAAQKAVLWAEGRALQSPSEEPEEEEELLEEEGAEVPSGPYEVQTALCYRVERVVGPEGLRCLTRPDDFAPPTQTKLLPGEEIMAKSVDGSPLSVQYVELADGRGWLPWDCRSLRYRLALSAQEFRVGQRVQAKVQMEYGSGDVIEKGMCGVVERVLPFVGVRWDSMTGVKAVKKPRASLRDEPTLEAGTGRGYWARAAPNFIFITATRELCEQVATTARQLGNLLPEEARKEWTVATAVGPPPMMGSGTEQWPFPMGEQRPKVLVATIKFLSYFFHRRHVTLWGNVHYIVYDEVDYLLTSPERKLLNRVRTMVGRAKKTYDGFVNTQQVAVCSTLPSQGRHSAFLRLREWMPAALRAMPRTPLLHRSHPLVPMKWQLVPASFNEKVELLVAELKKASSVVKRKGGREEYRVKDKTIIFVNHPTTAVELAEALGTGHNIGKVGLFISHIGNDARKERLRMFRRGEIMVMVCTDLLSRGIDIPDLRCMVQFEFASNVTDHIARIGRVSRAGVPGYAINYYNAGKGGHKLLAEAIQYCGDKPLDGLFSRRHGFRNSLIMNSLFRRDLIRQNLPLPPHFVSPEPLKKVPLLAAVLDGTENTTGEGDGTADGIGDLGEEGDGAAYGIEDMGEEGDGAAEGDESYEEDVEGQEDYLSAEEDFDSMTASEKDAAYLKAAESWGKNYEEGDSLEGGLLSEDDSKRKE